MRNIELPSLVLRTELGRLAENFLHHRVIMLVPVSLSLHHKNRDVLVEGEVILLQRTVDSLGVTSDPRILDGLRLFTERVNMLVREILKLTECFFLRRLVEDEVFEEIEVLL